MTRVRRIELRLVGLPLVRPFRTSFGIATRKECVVVRVETDAAEGWGECVADIEPDFSSEWNQSAWSAIQTFLGPPCSTSRRCRRSRCTMSSGFVRGNPMAKATLVNAVLDAELRRRGESLASYLGAARESVVCGVSVGITETVDELRAQVDAYLADGYRRIELKIAPGVDLDRVAAIRADHPDVLLSVDANAAYTLDDLDVFRALDDLGLLMIEQPLHHEDLVQHAKLQARDPHGSVPGRVDPVGGRRGRRPRARRLPHRQRQAGARRRRARGARGP